MNARGRATFVVICYKGETYAKVDDVFVAFYGPQLSDTWHLTVPKVQDHWTVGYIQTVSHPKWTSGIRQIREYYGLEGDFWCELEYLGDSRFNLKIYEKEGEEIRYVFRPDPEDPSDIGEVIGELSDGD
jgi:hypothetical protein